MTGSYCQLIFKYSLQNSVHSRNESGFIKVAHVVNIKLAFTD